MYVVPTYRKKSIFSLVCKIFLNLAFLLTSLSLFLPLTVMFLKPKLHESILSFKLPLLLCCHVFVHAIAFA